MRPRTRSAALGFVTGLRSQMALALLAQAVARADVPGDGTRPFRLLAHPAVRGLLAAASVGELVGDKLPVIPSRLEAGPLAGRLALGAAAGALAGRSAGTGGVTGAALGAVGAAAGSSAGYHLRALLTRRTPVPDAVWAVAEDVAAYRLARGALGSP
jgi:uncharacterized membrane protein